MSKHHSYLNTASEILKQYKGEQPFSNFLKSFYGQFKKYGSKDRKTISHLCYCYFRLGHALQEIPVQDRILIGTFFCEQQPNEVLSTLRPEWNEKISLSLQEKIELTGNHFSIDAIFPWKNELSESINYVAYSSSFLIQPLVYLRIRPGKEDLVRKKLSEANISFQEISTDCLATPNASKLDAIVEFDREVVVQDLNSQKIGQYISQAWSHTVSGEHDIAKRVQSGLNRNYSIWDCCAASGGKSILAFDLIPKAELFVSDVRPAILANLSKRFSRAGIRNYHSFIADLMNPDLDKIRSELQVETGWIQNLIICDAPCTGSGTWSRTPEQLFYFQEEKIRYYSRLQKSIITNLKECIAPGMHFLYVTCSVFREENEEVVEFIQKETGLRLEGMELFEGYGEKADTMFAALLVRE